MAEVTDRLGAALADRCRIEREPRRVSSVAKEQARSFAALGTGPRVACESGERRGNASANDDDPNADPDYRGGDDQ